MPDDANSVFVGSYPDVIFLVDIYIFSIIRGDRQRLRIFAVAGDASHPYLMALLKFGILSTAGEVIGLRITTGRYNEPGFGILPHAVAWGFLGVWIAAMMKTLSIGVPAVAESFGIEGVAAAMKGEPVSYTHLSIPSPSTTWD